MKKQELIHLHGLLTEVADYYEEFENDEIPLNEYESLGVQSTSIHKSKTDHKKAVFALAGGITSAMNGSEEQEPVPASAD